MIIRWHLPPLSSVFWDGRKPYFLPFKKRNEQKTNVSGWHLLTSNPLTSVFCPKTWAVQSLFFAKKISKTDVSGHENKCENSFYQKKVTELNTHVKGPLGIVIDVEFYCWMMFLMVDVDRGTFLGDFLSNLCLCSYIHFNLWINRGTMYPLLINIWGLVTSRFQ